MVSSGALVDKLISANSDVKKDIRNEFLQIAEQITTTDDDALSCDDNVETLVHSVINQLEALAKHIRRVSLSASCGNLPFSIPEDGIVTDHPNGQGSSEGRFHPTLGGFYLPSPGPLLPKSMTQLRNAGQMPLMLSGRRSSLKTSRELLTFGSVETEVASSLQTTKPPLSQTGTTTNSNVQRRRSIMFTLKTFAFKSEEHANDTVLDKCADVNDALNNIVEATEGKYHLAADSSTILLNSSPLILS